MPDPCADGHYAAVELRAVLISPDGEETVTPRDVSETGVCVVGPVGHEPGSIVRLRLWLDFGQGRVSEPFTTSFRVVWSTPIQGVFQIGATLARPDERKRKFLATLVHFMTRDVLQEGGELRFQTRH